MCRSFRLTRIITLSNERTAQQFSITTESGIVSPHNPVCQGIHIILCVYHDIFLILILYRRFF